MEEVELDAHLGTTGGTDGAERLPDNDDPSDRSVLEEVALVLRSVFSFCVIACIAIAIVMVMLMYFDIEAHHLQYFGGFPFARYVPQILYSAIPVMLGTLLEPVVVALNEFEMHPTVASAEDALIIKQFAVQFFNRSASAFVAIA